MLLNPRYGRLGLLAVPYFWIFEGLAPVVEVLGYGMLVLSAVAGILDVPFAVLFLALAVLYGVLLSQIGVGVEAFLLQRYPRVSDRLILLAAAFLESAGLRQLLALERFAATFRVGRREWGEMRRVGIPAEGGPAG
jgi:hypothetical protein